MRSCVGAIDCKSRAGDWSTINQHFYSERFDRFRLVALCRRNSIPIHDNNMSWYHANKAEVEPISVIPEELRSDEEVGCLAEDAKRRKACGEYRRASDKKGKAKKHANSAEVKQISTIPEELRSSEEVGRFADDAKRRNAYSENKRVWDKKRKARKHANKAEVERILAIPEELRSDEEVGRLADDVKRRKAYRTVNIKKHRTKRGRQKEWRLRGEEKSMNRSLHVLL